MDANLTQADNVDIGEPLVQEAKVFILFDKRGKMYINTACETIECVWGQALGIRMDLSANRILPDFIVEMTNEGYWVGEAFMTNHPEILMPDTKRINNLKAENRTLHNTIGNLAELCGEGDLTIQANDKGFVVYGEGFEVFGETVGLAIDQAIDQKSEQ